MIDKAPAASRQGQAEGRPPSSKSKSTLAATNLDVIFAARQTPVREWEIGSAIIYCQQP